MHDMVIQNMNTDVRMLADFCPQLVTIRFSVKSRWTWRRAHSGGDQLIRDHRIERTAITGQGATFPGRLLDPGPDLGIGQNAGWGTGGGCGEKRHR